MPSNRFWQGRGQHADVLLTHLLQSSFTRLYYANILSATRLSNPHLRLQSVLSHTLLSTRNNTNTKTDPTTPTMSASYPGVDEATLSRDSELDFIAARKKVIKETSDSDLGNLMTDLWNGKLHREEQEALVIQAMDFVMQRDSGFDGVEEPLQSVEKQVSAQTALPGMLITCPVRTMTDVDIVQNNQIRPATKHGREEFFPRERGKRVKHEIEDDEDIDEADAAKLSIKRKARGRPPAQAQAPIPTLSSETTIAVESTVEPLDTVIWVPKAKGSGGTLTPLRPLSGHGLGFANVIRFCISVS
jgi:hypothetical protein